MAFLQKNISVALQVARINRQLKSTAALCQEPVFKTLLTQAALIASEQRSLCPVDPSSTNPGAARDSIRVEEGAPTAKKAFVVKIKAGGEKTQRKVTNGKAGFGYVYDYVRALEFGTQNMAAKPFFFPIWRARRKEARAAVRKAVKLAVPKVFK